MAHVLASPQGRQYVQEVITQGLQNGELKTLPRQNWDFNFLGLLMFRFLNSSSKYGIGWK